MDTQEEISRLADMRDKGLLTAEQFESLKAQQLRSAAPSMPPPSPTPPLPTPPLPTTPLPPPSVPAAAKKKYSFGARLAAAVAGVLVLLAVLAVVVASHSNSGPANHSGSATGAGPAASDVPASASDAPASDAPATTVGDSSAQDTSTSPADLAVGTEVEYKINPDEPGFHRGTILKPSTEQGAGLYQAQILSAPSPDHPQDSGPIWMDVNNIRPLNAAHVATRPLAWFLGRWDLAATGATVDNTRSDGYVYRQEEGGTGLGQSLLISQDGSYVWQALPGAAPIKGSWRTTNEPGARVVLLAGDGGRDWTVSQESSTLPGDHIELFDHYASTRYGSRKE